MNDYQPPVDKLLRYGDPSKRVDWPDYLALGLTQQDAPELIRMATDRELAHALSESLEVWAPVHAWRALGQLKATSAIEPLIGLWKHYSDDLEDDWLLEDLPHVFPHFGVAAVAPLQVFISNASYPVWGRVAGTAALYHLVEQEPDQRDTVVSILTAELAKQLDDDIWNAELIASLLDLRAIESAEVIKAAYAAERVDLMVNGDWNDARTELGIPDGVIIPGPEPKPMDKSPFPMFSDIRAFPDLDSDFDFALPTPPLRIERKDQKKAKKKQKQQKQSRKQNRKKK
ncbi:MAG: DUF1186 domain-containing protein [Anaerolineae bacterium]